MSTLPCIVSACKPHLSNNKDEMSFKRYTFIHFGYPNLSQATKPKGARLLRRLALQKLAKGADACILILSLFSYVTGCSGLAAAGGSEDSCHTGRLRRTEEAQLL